MRIDSATPLHWNAGAASSSAREVAADRRMPAGEDPLREAFDQFVGQTFYGHLLASMRKTVGKPAYFHGGRAEEIFQQQLDQVLAEQLTSASAEELTGPMYDLFMLPPAAS